jgi:hypothetical protein
LAILFAEFDIRFGLVVDRIKRRNQLEQSSAMADTDHHIQRAIVKSLYEAIGKGVDFGFIRLTYRHTRHLVSFLKASDVSRSNS